MAISYDFARIVLLNNERNGKKALPGRAGAHTVMR